MSAHRVRVDDDVMKRLLDDVRKESTHYGRSSGSESEAGSSRPESRSSLPYPDSDATDLESASVTGQRTVVGENGSLKHEGAGTKYRVYRWRWLMLATIFLLNISNGTMWLSFAPIPNYSAAFYGVAVSSIDWFSVSYFITSLTVGFLAIAVLDIWGLRVSLYLGAFFNFTGSALRLFSTIPFIVCSPVYIHSGFLVAMIGQVLTACAQPFLLYSPTKLAALWFGPKERAFCTMLASLGNPIGLALAQLVSPNIVTSTEKLPFLMLTYSVPSLVATILTLVAFWHKTPPHPPAPSADKLTIPFFKGLKEVLTNLSFWVLLIVWGCSAGLFNALLTLLPQILCPFGYTDEDSGMWGALMIFCGLVGATIAGIAIDHTKRYKEIAVMTLSFALLCFILFMEVSSLNDQPVVVAISLCLFGFFALPLIPACMEVGVEITYPVAEATSSGLLWSAVQVMGIVLVLIGQTVQSDISPEQRAHSQCAIQPINTNSTGAYACLSNHTSTDDDYLNESKDLTYSLLIYAVLGVLMLCLLVIAFQPKLNRLETEKRAQMLAKLQQETPSTGASTVSFGQSESIVEPSKLVLGESSPNIKLHQTSRLPEHNTKF